MNKAGTVWCAVVIWGILIAGTGALAADDASPYRATCANMLNAIAKKTATLETINATLEEERTAYDALGAMLAGGDYGELKKGDIIKAQQKIFSAMQHEIQAADALSKSIEKLQDSLASLGWQEPAIPQPVSFWKLDEGQGPTVYDSIGANHGTIHSAAWVDGLIGYALDFDGNGDCVSVPDIDDTLDFFAGEDFSLCMWFNIGDGPVRNGPHLIDKRENGGQYPGFFIAYEDRPSEVHYGQIVFYIDNGDGAGFIISDVQVNDAQWHHLTAIRAGNTLKLYIDGASAAEDVTAEGLDGDLSNTNPLILGINHALNGKDYSGHLDEVAVFRTALTDEQVWQIYDGALDY